MTEYDELFGQEDHVEEMAGQLLAYLRGRLSSAEKQAIEHHVDDCGACRLALVHLEKAEQAVLGELLIRDVNELSDLEIDELLSHLLEQGVSAGAFGVTDLERLDSVEMKRQLVRRLKARLENK